MIIKIPGIPIAQKRHRHTKVGGFVRVYDPSAKDKVSIIGKIKASLFIHNSIDPQQYPIFHAGHAIYVDMTFDMPIPVSFSKAKRKRCIEGDEPHTSKPDLDNLSKIFLDCMNGLIFNDDAQVVTLLCHKKYSEDPKTIIEINTVM